MAVKQARLAVKVKAQFDPPDLLEVWRLQAVKAALQAGQASGRAVQVV